MILDLFAGPGGWDTGLRYTGYDGPIVGIEHDAAACATAHAAGHPRIRADVATYPTAPFIGRVDGLLASPPCQPYSTAGEQQGKRDIPATFRRMQAFATGREPTTERWADERSALTAEPMRYVADLLPRWIAWEQVPAALPLWQYAAELLRGLGYQAWTGVLSAEQYGVPQTRKRAILIARHDGQLAGPPAPTHQAYRFGRDNDSVPNLFGDPLPPPISMAQALGWDETWAVAYQRGAGMAARHGERPHRSAASPSPTIRSGVGGCGTNLLVLRNDPQGKAAERRADEPADTMYRSRPGNLEWVVRTGNNSRVGGGQTVTYEREISAPSPTLTGNVSRWQIDGTDPVRVSIEDAATLQSFPPGYPWQGTKSQQYQQVGNAVPPLLAAAILQPLLISRKVTSI